MRIRKREGWVVLGVGAIVCAAWGTAAEGQQVQAAQVPAQVQTPVPAQGGGGEAAAMTFRDFLAEVAVANLDYAAARYGVPIAEAQLAAARVSPNPLLTLGTAGRDITDRSGQKEPANDEAGIAQTIELGGKRGKRVTVARAGVAQAAATLADFFRTLRANAAAAWVDALTKRRQAAEKLRSTEALDELVAANRKRLDVGDIGEIDVTQSRVDALQSRADYLAAESDSRVAAIVLEQLLGRRRPAGKLVPGGNLEGPAHPFDQDGLIEQALRERPDVVAARQAVAAAQASVEVARALAVPDLSVGLTYQENERSTNSIAPAPAFSSLGLSVSVALPVFNRYRGEVLGARAVAAQAAAALAAAELRVRVEMLAALARYQVANQRAEQYKGGAIDDAAEVYKAKLFSYEHGAATLLDVLNARTTENNVRLAYLDALDERALALVGVEQAAGIWDIDF